MFLISCLSQLRACELVLLSRPQLAPWQRTAKRKHQMKHCFEPTGARTDWQEWGQEANCGVTSSMPGKCGNISSRSSLILPSRPPPLENRHGTQTEHTAVTTVAKKDCNCTYGFNSAGKDFKDVNNNLTEQVHLDAALSIKGPAFKQEAGHHAGNNVGHKVYCRVKNPRNLARL